MQTSNPTQSQKPLPQSNIPSSSANNQNALNTKEKQRSKSEFSKPIKATPKTESKSKAVTKVPESTEKVLIFSLIKGNQWQYETKAFTPEKVGFRCTLNELNQIFSDIYNVVDNFKLVKASEKKKGLFSCLATSKPTSSKKEAATKIQQVLNMYAPAFNTRGLNITLNNNCIDWIELHLDYQPLTQLMSAVTSQPSSRKTSNAVKEDQVKPKVEPYRLTPSKPNVQVGNTVGEQKTADTFKSSSEENTSLTNKETSSNKENINESVHYDVAPSSSDSKPNVYEGAPSGSDANTTPRRIFGTTKQPVSSGNPLQECIISQNGTPATYISEEFIFGDAKGAVHKRTIPAYKSSNVEPTHRETQAEDVVDDVSDDENGPAINFAQESTTLHESSMKRNYYITSTY